MRESVFDVVSMPARIRRLYKINVDTRHSSDCEILV